MNRDLKKIQDQKDTLMAALDRGDIYLDGDGYRKVLENYKTLTEIEEIKKKGKFERNPLEWLLKIGGFIVTAIGVIVVPQLLADKAYDNEKELNLKNGTIWNLIGKDFSPKKK